MGRHYYAAQYGYGRDVVNQQGRPILTVAIANSREARDAFVAFSGSYTGTANYREDIPASHSAVQAIHRNPDECIWIDIETGETHYCDPVSKCGEAE